MFTECSVPSLSLTPRNLTAMRKHNMSFLSAYPYLCRRIIFPALVCQRSRTLQVICLYLHIFGHCSLQEVRGGTAEQYSRPACSHRDNHTPCPRSLCSQVKHSCSANRLWDRFFRLLWTWFESLTTAYSLCLLSPILIHVQEIRMKLKHVVGISKNVLLLQKGIFPLKIKIQAVKTPLTFIRSCTTIYTVYGSVYSIMWTTCFI